MENQNNENSKKGFWGFANNSFEKHPWISMFTITGVISGVFAGVKGIIEAIRRPKDSWTASSQNLKDAASLLKDTVDSLDDDDPKTAEVIDITPSEEEKEEE